MFSFLKRKPKPILVFISGAAHELLPGQAIEALGQDRSKLVVTRAEGAGPPAIEIVAFAPARTAPRFRKGK